MHIDMFIFNIDSNILFLNTNLNKNVYIRLIAS